MRNTALSLTALAAFTAPTIVMAQPAQAPLTGSQVIITLAKAKGVVLTPAQIVAIQRNPGRLREVPGLHPHEQEAGADAHPHGGPRHERQRGGGACAGGAGFRAVHDRQDPHGRGRRRASSRRTRSSARSPRSRSRRPRDPTIVAAVNTVAAAAQSPVTARGGGS